jgi:hypothetical protein
MHAAHHTSRQDILQLFRHYQSVIARNGLFQARLAERKVLRKRARSKSSAILMGLIFDDRGHPGQRWGWTADKTLSVGAGAV